MNHTNNILPIETNLQKLGVLTIKSLFIQEAALEIFNKPDYFATNQEIHNYGTRWAVKVYVQ